MNAHAFPLTATVDAARARSGLHGATVDTGLTETPFVFVGYLDRESALQAGERFALAMGRRPIMPPDYRAPASEPRRETTPAPVRVGRHGDGRRRSRRHVRAAKSAWLDGAGPRARCS
jgi:hypothetical protein